MLGVLPSALSNLLLLRDGVLGVPTTGTLTAMVLRLAIFLLDAGRSRAEEGVILDFLVDFLIGVVVDLLSSSTSGVLCIVF